MCLGFIFQRLKGSHIVDSWKGKTGIGFRLLKEIPVLVVVGMATGCIAGSGTKGRFTSMQIGGDYVNTTRHNKVVILKSIAHLVILNLFQDPGIEILLSMVRMSRTGS